MGHQAKLKVKPNLGCCSNIARTISLHLSFCFILIIPRLAELRPFKCQGRAVSLWRWPLTCNLEKGYSLRLSFGMYYIERQFLNLHSLTRHCPCNFLPEPTTPKHECRGKLWGHPVTSSMTSSPWKKTQLFCIIWDDLFIFEVKLKLCLLYKNVQNGRHFELATSVFTGSDTGGWIYQKDSR